MVTFKNGSSPLTRGKHPPRPRAARRRGLIPAHAGKTVLRAFGAGACAAHPRSRGENLLFDNVGKDLPGSSPLTRGKQLLLPVLQFSERLIPAHAGKTLEGRSQAVYAGAHPRSRGENPVATLPATIAPGSSPLTRGKRQQRNLQVCRHGAHPRSRGENSPGAMMMCPRTGSSPLTRGKLYRGGQHVRRHRLIPAHAGKTRESLSSGTNSRAHPRSRGENPHCTPRSPLAGGSSPLTRGKPRGP